MVWGNQHVFNAYVVPVSLARKTYKNPILKLELSPPPNHDSSEPLAEKNQNDAIAS